jgi:hypothetical protein
MQQQQAAARLRGQTEGRFMTHIIETRVIGNHAAMGRSTPEATGKPDLTVHEALRAAIRRAAGRHDTAAAQSTWDSEGGATEAGE